MNTTPEVTSSERDGQVYTEVLTVPMLAEYLKISQSTIRDMANGNEIPHMRIRGRLLFYIHSIREWLENMHAETTEAKPTVADDIANEIIRQIRST